MPISLFCPGPLATRFEKLIVLFAAIGGMICEPLEHPDKRDPMVGN